MTAPARDPYTDLDPEAQALEQEADRWLDAAEPDPSPVDAVDEWERMAGTAGELPYYAADEFFAAVEFDQEHAKPYGAGYVIDELPVMAARPLAEVELEFRTGYPIDTLRDVVRIGRTPNRDHALQDSLQRALFDIRNAARRPTLDQLADALACDRKTISRHAHAHEGRGNCPTSRHTHRMGSVRPEPAGVAFGTSRRRRP